MSTIVDDKDNFIELNEDDGVYVTYKLACLIQKSNINLLH